MGRWLLLKGFEKNTLKTNDYRCLSLCRPLTFVTRYPRLKINLVNHRENICGLAPKSSVLNERTTIVVENEQFGEVYTVRLQELARRIVNYAKLETAVQGEDAGFSGWFACRCLLTGTPVNVALDQVVRGETIIAENKTTAQTSSFPRG